MSSQKLDFTVQMTYASCVQTVQEALEDVPGIENCDIDLETGRVSVQTTLSQKEVLKHLQGTGKKAFVRESGGIAAAIACLNSGSDIVKGIVRFVQEPGTCVVDGTIYGLEIGAHRLTVHESGDVSQGCDHVGQCINPVDYQEEGDENMYGDLGIILVDETGRSAFAFDDNVLKLKDILGKALVISDARSSKRLACGVIARSANLF